MEDLLKIMKRLRGPNGCPWDREQTHESLRTNVIEEAYEVVDAIESKDDSALCEELGDLLLQIAFHCVIAQEENRFDYEQVEKRICDKLVSRHSHIFGNDTAENVEEVLKLWRKNKETEKGNRSLSEAMEAVPASFPGLMKSFKVQEKAASAGYGSKNLSEAVALWEEKSNRLKEGIDHTNKADLEQLFGELLFSVVNVCRFFKIDPEIAVSKTVKRFVNGFSQKGENE
jgi:tetrapyrrole methylase family protein/MazG family protein